MTGRLLVAPVVEGHGEVQSVRTLVTRVAAEIFEFDGVVVLRPVRIPRAHMIRSEHVQRAVTLAKLKTDEVAESEDHRLVLVLFDADDEKPCELAPAVARGLLRDDVEVSVVLPSPEYETWFVAAAVSLHEYVKLAQGEVVPSEPERVRAKKAWIESRFRGRYSPTVDQPKLTARMDLHACRTACPSFDKLCRELQSSIERARGRVP